MVVMIILLVLLVDQGQVAIWEQVLQIQKIMQILVDFQK